MKKKKASQAEISKDDKERGKFMEEFMYEWMKLTPKKKPTKKEWYRYAFYPFEIIGKLSLEMGKDNLFGQRLSKFQEQDKEVIKE